MPELCSDNHTTTTENSKFGSRRLFVMPFLRRLASLREFTYHNGLIDPSYKPQRVGDAVPHRAGSSLELLDLTANHDFENED